MKKHIKLIVFVLSLIVIFVTYNAFSKQNSKLIYIPLGDSIAEGVTPYNSVDYGYPDYIADYLKKENKLDFYTKVFSKSGYTTQDLTNDINNNKVIEVDGKILYLKEILRESDLLTLTIGANNIIRGMSSSSIAIKLLDISKFKKEVSEVTEEVKELIILIKKYAKNQIIVTGYFNPLPNLKEYKDQIDEMIKYYNNLIEEICAELDVTYVDIFESLDKNPDSFPNPINIHPNKKGYELISKEIIKNIE